MQATFTKDETKAFYNLLSRAGFKVDITEAEAIVQLKMRVVQEMRKIEAEEKAVIERATKKTLAENKKSTADKPAAEPAK